MTRLLVGSFVCLVICLLIPGLVVGYLNLDRIDHAKWQGRLAAMNRLQAKADEIGQQADDMLKRWGDSTTENAPSKEELQQQHTQLKRDTLETIKLTNALQGAIAEGIIQGGEVNVKWGVKLASMLTFVLSGTWVVAVFLVTLKFGRDRWTMRQVARSLLRDIGVNVSQIPKKELMKTLTALGVCKWHLAQMAKLLEPKQMPTHARSLAQTLQEVSRRFNQALYRSDIPTVPPAVYDARQLSRERAMFALQISSEMKRIRREERVWKESVTRRVKEDLSRQEAELETRRQQLLVDQRALETERRHREENRHQLAMSLAELHQVQREVEQEQQRAARNRSYAAMQLKEAQSVMMTVERWGRRIDASVLHLQSKLATLDPEGTHPDRGEIVHALAAALAVVEPYRDGEPAYAI